MPTLYSLHKKVRLLSFIKSYNEVIFVFFKVIEKKAQFNGSPSSWQEKCMTYLLVWWGGGTQSLVSGFTRVNLQSPCYSFYGISGLSHAVYGIIWWCLLSQIMARGESIQRGEAFFWTSADWGGWLSLFNQWIEHYVSTTYTNKIHIEPDW